MNKRGAVFAILTVIFVFIFIFGSLVYKTHIENKINIEEVGLDSVDLIRQRINFELDSYFVKKEIEYMANNILVKFVESEGKEYFDDPKKFDKELFFQWLTNNEEFYNYVSDFRLDGDVVEFNIIGFRGIGKIRNIERCKREVVNLIKEQVGRCDYELGAKGPCDNGFDCSGLVKWTYMNSDVGINYFPDGSWVQASWGRRTGLNVDEIGVGAKLKIEELSPGDIVFFKGSLDSITDNYGENLGIRHVGVYTGEGEFGKSTFIEAAGKSIGVREWDIEKKSNYRGAIRVCSEDFDGGTGIFSKDIKYNYKIDLDKRKFITFEGLKDIT